MFRTYKRKLKLTREQSSRIDSWIGACRVVYNLALEIKIASYKATGKSPSAYDLMKQLPALRTDIEWVADVPARTLEATITRLENSYKTFFKGGGFPKWASKQFWKSISFRQDISCKNGKIRIHKLGYIPMFKDSPIIGTITTAQIIKEPTGYFICIQCKNVPNKFDSENQATGLDMGLTHFCIDANGTFVENPKHFKQYERRLRIENRSLSRKQKGSNRWKKQAKRLSMFQHRIGNVRKDFLHKTSTNIAKKYDTVYMEDLKISNMVRNKSLSKHILDCGWGMFRTMLEYKTTVVRVDPKHTSQTCSQCGHVDKENRKTQADFVCLSCGFSGNADVNAANNIKQRGHRLQALTQVNRPNVVCES